MELITDLKAIRKEMGLRPEGSSLWGEGFWVSMLGEKLISSARFLDKVFSNPDRITNHGV